MARSPQLPSNAIVIVELAVDDDVCAPVLVCDGLIPSFEIDYAQASMAQAYLAISTDPQSMAIGTTAGRSPGGSMITTRATLTQGSE